MPSRSLAPDTSNSNNLSTMGEESGREQVLGDGVEAVRRSARRCRHDAAIPKALQQVADDLAAQYAITYALPDGVQTGSSGSTSASIARG